MFAGSVLAGALALYILTVGPAWWVMCRRRTPRWLRLTLRHCYEPIWVAYAIGPRWLVKKLVWYLRLFGPWDTTFEP